MSMAPRVSKGSAKSVATQDMPPADHLQDTEPASTSSAPEIIEEDLVDTEAPPILIDDDDDNDEYDLHDDLHDDLEGDVDDDVAMDMFDPLQQLTQLFLTEDGVPIADILQGIREALEKQSKILFKISNILEQRPTSK